MSDKMSKEELMGLLDENYYTLGVTGSEAAYTILSDLSQGNLSQSFEEWGIEPHEFIMAYNDLIDKWIEEGKMEVAAMEWYGWYHGKQES